MDFDIVIFKKTKFSDILSDIYANSKKTEKQVSDLVGNLAPYIDGPGSAAIIVPLIKEYLEVKVKNDENLIKMAAIVQRALNATTNINDEFVLSPKEEEQLRDQARLIHEKQINLIENTKLPVLEENK